MRTEHRIYFKDARTMAKIAAGSVELVVTSPPYPMIEMWDAVFAARSSAVRNALVRGEGLTAFEGMHRALDPVWKEVHRILKPGGLACINIGDAARRLGADFMLYPNHARILTALLELGFRPLPVILWRKQTNAPNKFMGSGMYPAGAYVTLEHEYILIARKGAKREFASAEEKRRRRQSAVFWEERNRWYSDVWMELKGARQSRRQEPTRPRSGAFPFELAYRLICMFSVEGDTVVDPFAGTGTTLLAAAAAGRHSMGWEIEPAFRRDVFARLALLIPTANGRIQARLVEHAAFVEQCRQSGRPLKYVNRYYRFPVVTRQESELRLRLLRTVTPRKPDGFEVHYADEPTLLDPDNKPPCTEAPSAGASRQLPLI